MTFDELVAKYPKILGKVGYASIGDGWLPIIEKLCSSIEERVAKDESLKHPVAVQIKEKFGGLRFYADGDNSFYDLIDEAEKEADRTCEVCGDPGRERSGGWIKTLCDTHAK